MNVFSQEWAAAWQASINADEAYRDAGRKWVGAVVLKAWADESTTLESTNLEPTTLTGPRRSAAPRSEAAKSADGAGEEVDTQSAPSEGQGDAAGWSIWADLADGHCREARIATAEDATRARIVVGAPLSTWTQVLAGELDPILGLVRGRLKLERGSLVSLVPHARGARALLASAARIEAKMPGSGGHVVDPISPPPPAVADATSWPLATTPPPVAEAAARTHEPRTSATAPPISDPGPGATDSATAPGDEAPPSSRTFQSTRSGLDHGAFPMRLWHKAKKLGVWDPRDIDLEQDRRDWEGLDELERDVLLRLAALFQAGEEAVTLDLIPLMGVVASEGRLEEEMYLTSFLWEEAKHVEAFRRFIDEVARHEGDLDQYATPSYRTIFEDELPRFLQRLRTDASPEAQARAAVVYNMIVEGVLAETGYHGYQRILEDNGIMPGVQELVRYVKRDESRHIAYGLFLLSRLVAENGPPVRALIEDEMARLLDPALQVITEVFDAYEVMPFGLELDVFTAFGLSQFQHRLGRLERAWSAGALVTDVG